MAATAEIEQRVAFESERRLRLGVPAIAGGVLYLLSAIILNASLKELPTVGIVQGLEPALRGEANPTVSPRAAEVSYIDHHAFGLIVGTILTTIAVLVLTLVLVFVIDCVRFRRAETWVAGRPLVLIGGVGYALLNLIHEIALAFEAHNFVGGSNFSSSAVEKALLTTGFGDVFLVLGLLAALALAVGIIAVMVGSMRTGLLPRWLSMLGILSGLLFLPLFGTGLVTSLIPTFWLVAVGVLLMERWPNGDPPAWAAGEARPWPTQADMRAQREAASGDVSGGRSRGSKTARNGDAPDADVAPAPIPAVTGSRRKRRKRG